MLYVAQAVQQAASVAQLGVTPTGMGGRGREASRVGRGERVCWREPRWGLLQCFRVKVGPAWLRRVLLEQQSARARRNSRKYWPGSCKYCKYCVISSAISFIIRVLACISLIIWLIVGL